ncbi:MAG: hypothetical protein QXP53_02505 [Candidatus Pacearchaeota archaeon]
MKKHLEPWYFEHRHNKRFSAIFLMFVVIAAALGVTLAFSISTNIQGKGIFDSITNLFSSKQTSTCYDSDANLTWPNQYFVRGYCQEGNSTTKQWDYCEGEAMSPEFQESLENPTVRRLTGLAVGQFTSHVCYEYRCNAQQRCVTQTIDCRNLTNSTGECYNGACQRPMNLNDSIRDLVAHRGIYWVVLQMLNSCKYVQRANPQGLSCNQICYDSENSTCIIGGILLVDGGNSSWKIKQTYPCESAFNSTVGQALCTCCRVPTGNNIKDWMLHNECFVYPGYCAGEAFGGSFD